MKNLEERIFNFSAGPCCLPYEVLLIAKNELTNFQKSGMSVMEMSHRSKNYMKIHEEALNTLKDVLHLPTNYKLLFMQGGATLQFAAVPLNLLPSSNFVPTYAITGLWSSKAFQEAQKYCEPLKVCDTKDTNYNCIPSVCEWNLQGVSSDLCPYLHYCANETIQGVEFKENPKVNLPLVSDMSSNFCSKPIDFGRHIVIYAGAQKNLGPSGVTIVIVDESSLGKEMKICPSLMSYKITSDNNSLFNTPPCYSIYMVGLMAKYLKQKGGLSYWEEYNAYKSSLIYDVIDDSHDYYRCHAEKSCRSCMNIPFRVAGGNSVLEAKFVEDAKKKKLYSLSGHRSVGGCRASVYNGMTAEGVETLANFMKEFMEENQV